MNKKQLGKGYSYLLAILGCVMLVAGSIHIDFKLAKGQTNLEVRTQPVQLPLLGVYISMIAAGLGIRFTIPGVIGATLPSSVAVEELGEKISRSD